MKETNQTSLKDVLKDMVETYRLKNRLNQTKIQQLWSSVMGNSISRHTSDLRVRKNKLYITIESAPLRQELAFGRDKIRRMMNQELGEEYLEEVVIR
jgi:predicted nucleic acid-binding Zn ribbon protein